MPTYDYRCITCGKEFEFFQSIKDKPLETCNCEKQGKVERLISQGSGIIFKGSGFYITDYKKSHSNQESVAAGSTASSKASENSTSSSSGSES